MASFTDTEIQRNHYIWTMFRDGGVTLVSGTDLMNRVTGDLLDEAYLVYQMDVQAIESTVAFEKTLRQEIGFPRGASGCTNLDSFRDLLGDLDFAQSTGIVVAVTNADSIYHQDRVYLEQVMHVFAEESRMHMCCGNRLLLVIQFSTCDIQFNPIGGRQPAWDIRA